MFSDYLPILQKSINEIPNTQLIIGNDQLSIWLNDEPIFKIARDDSDDFKVYVFDAKLDDLAFANYTKLTNASADFMAHIQ